MWICDSVWHVSDIDSYTSIWLENLVQMCAKYIVILKTLFIEQRWKIVNTK